MLSATLERLALAAVAAAAAVGCTASATAAAERCRPTAPAARKVAMLAGCTQKRPRRSPLSAAAQWSRRGVRRLRAAPLDCLIAMARLGGQPASGYSKPQLRAAWGSA